MEIKHDKVGLRLFIKLPQDLLTIWSEGDVLMPCAVPIWAVWIENSYGMLRERGRQFFAPVNIIDCSGCACEEYGSNSVDRLL